MLDELFQTASGQDIFEWVGLFSGIIYVFLAARGSWVCWIFGIISCGLIAFKDITSYKLYSDAALQIFYVLMGVWGLIQWQKDRSKEQSKQTILELPLGYHLKYIVALLLLSYPIGWLMNEFTDANFSYLDAITTVFSIFATVLLIQKYLSNWIYWIIIDILYVYIYGRGGGMLFAFLSLLYTFIAVYGYWSWRDQHRRSHHPP